jgi:hypothetical protein
MQIAPSPRIIALRDHTCFVILRSAEPTVRISGFIFHFLRRAFVDDLFIRIKMKDQYIRGQRFSLSQSSIHPYLVLAQAIGEVPSQLIDFELLDAQFLHRLLEFFFAHFLRVNPG